RLEERRVAEEVRVAGEADLRRRDAGEGRLLHRPVAVAAVDAVVADMVLVAEGNRLLRREQAALRRQRLIQREPGEGDEGEDCEQYKLDAEDCRPRKDLGHAARALSIPPPAKRIYRGTRIA